MGQLGVGGYPARSSWGGVPCQVQPGGYPGWGGTLARGGTQLGQHREYLLHGGRYASCVHAGGHSCSAFFETSFVFLYNWQFVTTGGRPCTKLSQLSWSQLSESGIFFSLSLVGGIFRWFNCCLFARLSVFLTDVWVLLEAQAYSLSGNVSRGSILNRPGVNRLSLSIELERIQGF